MRVLLIEDDRMVGAAVEQALRDAAYAVDWVTDGETAIQAAENEAYEVALLDLGLPVADGREVLRRLRMLDRKLPIIIVTARDGVDDRIDGLDLGADDYLVKPFEFANCWRGCARCFAAKAAVRRPSSAMETFVWILQHAKPGFSARHRC